MILVVTACSPAATTDSTASTLASSSTTTPSTRTSSTSSEVTLSDLVGDWDNGQLFLQIADDGSYQILETATSDPSDPLMGGFVARDGSNLNFVTDIYGECGGETGVYGGAMKDGQLVFTLVDDPCEFRATQFVEPWDRSS
jgi:hypothetical protein